MWTAYRSIGQAQNSEMAQVVENMKFVDEEARPAEQVVQVVEDLQKTVKISQSQQPEQDSDAMMGPGLMSSMSQSASYLAACSKVQASTC